MINMVITAFFELYLYLTVKIDCWWDCIFLNRHFGWLICLIYGMSPVFVIFACPDGFFQGGARLHCSVKSDQCNWLLHRPLISTSVVRPKLTVLYLLADKLQSCKNCSWGCSWLAKSHKVVFHQSLPVFCRVCYFFFESTEHVTLSLYFWSSSSKNALMWIPHKISKGGEDLGSMGGVSS